jgi:disulfide bond formation protein DsbB
MPNRFLSPQFAFVIGMLACLGVLASAYAIEHIYDIEPCPLCVLQRIVYWIMAVVCLLGAYHNSKTLVRYCYSLSALLLGIVGILLSGRQIWLQHLPIGEVPSCTAGLDRLLEVYPVLDVLKMVFTSSGECSVVNFTILGLSLAETSFISFGLLTLVSIWIIVLQKKRARNKH